LRTFNFNFFEEIPLDNTPPLVAGLISICFLLGCYFLPTIVAWLRYHRQAVAIFVLNLLLGWTVLGWIAALVWAFIKPAPPPTVIVQQPPASMS
jgi:hypothetical protein